MVSARSSLLLAASLAWLAPADAGPAQEKAATFIEFPHGYVTGGWSGTAWLNSEAAGQRVKPGTPFRVYPLKGPAGAFTLEKAAADIDVCPDVWLAYPLEEGERRRDGFAVAAAWDPRPRPVSVASTTVEVYRKAVREILIARGLRDPNVEITQHLRMDLEGDGEEEVLLAATHYRREPDGPAIPVGAGSGDYSFVALRRVVDGKVVTQILDGEFYEKAAEFNAPNVHRVGAVLDLDGDGTLEIVLHFDYYEGGGTTIWKLGPKGAERVLELGCGV